MSSRNNLLSVVYTTGTHTYPALDTRNGIQVIAEAGAVATISFGTGGSNVPVGVYIEPLEHTSGIFELIVTSGNVHVITGNHDDVVST